jgi:chitin synthase
LYRLAVVQGNLFISFFVLIDALKDPTIIGGKTVEVVNTVAKSAYVGLLLMCFILALRVSNRSRSLNRGYTVAFMGYAILTAYMTVCRHDRA